MNLLNILTGWYNYATGSEEVKALMEYRLSICNSCEFKGLAGTSGYCQKCICPLGPKTSAPGEKCPLDKWLQAGL